VDEVASMNYPCALGPELLLVGWLDRRKSPSDSWSMGMVSQ
jgi:hypothetical protein